ncbi:uncharacterized protein LOC143598663 [Bidens hawaiensis]|uniref:uncharacterized protein LOC143598663 n=1 Tax=Bidens hawaiensis TaxID=980011 RepID=UPI00404943ED
MVGNLRNKILEEAHKSKYMMHPGSDKMYHNLKNDYWWIGLKKDMALYVAKCLTYSKASRDRQKSYADIRRKPLEFKEGDRVLLKVSPWKDVVRFGKKGKPSQRFVGPFKIL